MSDNDLLDTYTEVFVMSNGDDGEAFPHFECSMCDRDVTDEPCTDHAPLTPPPGLREVECWAEPKHLLYVINRDDYGYPCPECRLVPHIEAEREAAQCRHWAWRRSRAWRWLAGRAYRLGIVHGTASSWGDGHEWCTTLSGIRGERRYILGAARETWRCWFNGHRRGEDIGMFGYCGKCLPCGSCGSERFLCNDGCPEAVSAP